MFDEIATLGPVQREARITDGNITAEVSDRVQAMLAADVRMPVLARATTDVIGRLRDDDEMLGRSLVGTRIGTFRLLELIGQGGSSAVFRAEREAGDGSQLVALKLLRTGLYSADAQRRFRREQSILAQLTHPNIASLIESGVSSAGIPYIAMELVDGMPITKAADAREPRRASSGWPGSRRCAGRSRPRMPRWSCTAISSRRTCWSRATAI